jgi:polyhydroxybutyrate depolymerase
MVLHGYTACADDIAGYTGWIDQADLHGFQLVIPQGTEALAGQADRQPSWNAGGCCGASVAAGIDDVGFLNKVLDDSVATLGADPARLLISGHSNGCAMAQRLGVESSDKVTAVACASFYLLSPTPSTYLTAVPFLEVHGQRDTTVPYNPSNRFGSWPGAELNLRDWAIRNKCTKGPVTRPLAGYTRVSYGECGGAGNSEVVLASFPEGTHYVFPLFGIPSASVEWEFLQHYSRNGSVIANTDNSLTYSTAEDFGATTSSLSLGAILGIAGGVVALCVAIAAVAYVRAGRRAAENDRLPVIAAAYGTNSAS